MQNEFFLHKIFDGVLIVMHAKYNVRLRGQHLEFPNYFSVFLLSHGGLFTAIYDSLQH